MGEVAPTQVALPPGSLGVRDLRYDPAGPRQQVDAHVPDSWEVVVEANPRAVARGVREGVLGSRDARVAIVWADCVPSIQANPLHLLETAPSQQTKALSIKAGPFKAKHQSLIHDQNQN